MDIDNNNNNNIEFINTSGYTYKKEQINALYYRQSQHLQRLPNVSFNNTLSDGSYRQAICQWGYDVTDYFGLDRSIVAYAMSYLDVLSFNYKCDYTIYRLAGLTSLFLSIKLHGFIYNQSPTHRKHTEFDIKLILSLSDQGEFKVGHVTAMEQLLCQALQWRMHPVIAVEFVGVLLDDFTTEYNNVNFKEMRKISLFCTELAVCDVYFTAYSENQVTASQIAVAAIRVALNVCGNHSNNRSALILQEDEHRISELEERLMIHFKSSRSLNVEESQEEKSQLSNERHHNTARNSVSGLDSNEKRILCKSCSSNNMLNAVPSHGSGLSSGITSQVNESDDLYSPTCVSTTSDSECHHAKH